MKISHRALTNVPLTEAAETLDLLPPLGIDKAPRLSCCCRLSELLPKVRELHDAARAAQLSRTEQPGVAA
jgi:hypothetical protein